jgi:putative nucleotidyltransferase with HDIG domain
MEQKMLVRLNRYIDNMPSLSITVAKVKSKSHFKALNVDGFWRHSIGVGAAAKLISGKLGIVQNLREEYFIGGLLHDIGKIPLNDVFDEEYLNVIRAADMNKVPLVQMENEMLGVNHTEVGRMIAEKWKLSSETFDCILNHHDPHQAQQENFKLVSAVYMANSYCNLNEIGFSGNRFSGKMDMTILQNTGVTLEFLDDLFDTISEEVEKASIFLHVSG